ncbi:gamma carbonic dehydratase [Angomonas deanei]|uniref:Bacterial transferase hexapeptide (Six repeats), putative n=1 Tax=Angomonas deanei TaxID=59799 RepID=S9VGX9_9TRYP|nr:gamma carbonic dehydratase [Angomonas deanei]EPY41529.1 gamma carbonic dehydratase [Angomonas deanei]CAD2222873.1 Bacterial transferase hexapeptide (six repeats), putative [Angomonas deanei]|eukprot:EPY26336.1 gamma carbonic dehydratase [Angomonas deanei]
MFRSRAFREASKSAAMPNELPSWAVKRRTWLSEKLDVLGVKMQKAGVAVTNFSNYFMGAQPKEALYCIPRLLRVHGKRPSVMDNCFVAPSALITGDVRVGRKNYIGYNAIIRAEQGETIYLGESCNIQEKAVITGNTTIGKWTTIEPMAIVESADIASCSFVGANAIVMKGSQIESGAMLAAASVLQTGAIIPSGEMWAGNPAQKIADLTEKEKEEIIKAAKHMVLLAIEHHDSWELTWEDLEDQREGRENWARYAENNREIRGNAMYIKEPPRPNRKPPGRLTPREQMDGGPGKPALWDVQYPGSFQ